jgi:hypothetical protein
VSAIRDGSSTVEPWLGRPDDELLQGTTMTSNADLKSDGVIIYDSGKLRSSQATIIDVSRMAYTVALRRAMEMNVAV